VIPEIGSRTTPTKTVTEQEQVQHPLRAIRLSPRQGQFILAAEFVLTDIHAEVARATRAFEATPPPRTVVVEIAHDRAEMFRATCTTRLAQVGFDESYRLTEEGQMLEDLIDAFGEEPG
jgi:hypothetical protein